MLKPRAPLPVSHAMLTNDARVALSPVSGGLVRIKLGGARRPRCAVQARCPNRLSSDGPFAARPRATRSPSWRGLARGPHGLRSGGERCSTWNLGEPMLAARSRLIGTDDARVALSPISGRLFRIRLGGLATQEVPRSRCTLFPVDVMTEPVVAPAARLERPEAAQPRDAPTAGSEHPGSVQASHRPRPPRWAPLAPASDPTPPVAPV